jgi:hypothetical protein
VAKHLPAVMWTTRRDTTKRHQIVSTLDRSTLIMYFFPGDGKDGFSLKLPRSDARLLARRINQCLEETKK